MIDRGYGKGVRSSSCDESTYWFEVMIGVQGGFIFPVKVEDGVAYWCSKEGEWIEDEEFPFECYNQYVTKKLEESIHD